MTVAGITEVPPVALLPNFLVQRKVLRPFRYQTGGTILVNEFCKLHSLLACLEYAHVYAHTHTHARILVFAHMHAHTLARMHKNMHAYMHVRIQTRALAYSWVQTIPTCSHAYIYIYIYIYMHVCMYMQTDTHTHTHTHTLVNSCCCYTKLTICDWLQQYFTLHKIEPFPHTLPTGPILSACIACGCATARQ